jgi:hydrogenase expression/formation protein HypE
MDTFPLGKLPPEVLDRWFSQLKRGDPRVILGPGVGLDCAVIDFGETLLIAKSDPITFTAADIGWYAVQINANDIATTGARPKWFLVTLLLPENRTDKRTIDEIFIQVQEACEELGIEIVGGHTEVTMGLDRPILSGTMLGEVQRESLITPQGASPGDAILLTKGIPLEAASILAREYADDLMNLDPDVLQRARDYLYNPGISVLKEALAASETGYVTAMHDPTEGGILSGLWELSDAASIGLEIQLESIPILPEAEVICQELQVNPLTAIASGTLLLTVKPAGLATIKKNIHEMGIPIVQIGMVVESLGVFEKIHEERKMLPRPARDALAELFEG